MKKQFLALLLTCALSVSMTTPTLAAGLDNLKKVNNYTPGQFTDVPADAWYTANVQAAYELGLMTGSSATAFNPSGNLTVAEALVLACRLHSAYTGDNASFSAGAGAWYQPYVDYAVSCGIIGANDVSDYSAIATRAQFAAILAAAFPDEALPAINSITSIPDLDANATYAAAVLKLYNAGILTGSDSAGTFNPGSTIQRAEVATIVTRMANKDLRKTFTLEPVPDTSDTSVSSSTKKFDGMVDADDLQGTWYGSNGKEEREWSFYGNRFSYTTSSASGRYSYITGTFTVTSEPLNGDNNICHIRVNANVEDGYFNESKGFMQMTQLPFTSSYEFNANLQMPQDCFIYYGTTFNRADNKKVYSAYLDALEAVGMKPPAKPDPAVVEYLASYAQTNGHKVTFGDYSGQYECYLDLYQTLGTNKDWNYSMYYDPASGNITLAGLYYSSSSESKYTFTSNGKCALVLTPELTTPYEFTYSGFDMVTGVFDELVLEPGDRVAKASIDPATFTDETESITFTSNEGFLSDDLRASAEKNCAVHIQIMLTALNREILWRGGYTLENLGFVDLDT